ncbi:hypothetical protein D0Z70_03500 [Sphingobium terrigena]|uniref:Uncharacterized protein n=1 Tax=Sphingobium terrigena TaxID=2304063 RepID=A0A418YXH9_9SPHN|nr:hypothetical protein [Sphingobium terrigena]RJG57284.1 hypothetical protein D0Z70_03500 [Sphingobium terrigena]
MGSDVAIICAGLDLSCRRVSLAQVEAILAEHEALPAIILHPQIVTEYRRQVDLLDRAIAQGETSKLEARASGSEFMIGAESEWRAQRVKHL